RLPLLVGGGFHVFINQLSNPSFCPGIGHLRSHFHDVSGSDGPVRRGHTGKHLHPFFHSCHLLQRRWGRDNPGPHQKKTAHQVLGRAVLIVTDRASASIGQYTVVAGEGEESDLQVV